MEVVLYPLSSIWFASSLSESPPFAFPRISMAHSLAVRWFFARFLTATPFFFVAASLVDMGVTPTRAFPSVLKIDGSSSLNSFWSSAAAIANDDRP